MKPLTIEQAKELFKSNKEVFKIYPDGSEAVVEDESDFNSHEKFGYEEENNIFKTVIKNKLQELNSIINNNAETFYLLKIADNYELTEDEILEKARDFFYSETSKQVSIFLTDKTK